MTRLLRSSDKIDITQYLPPFLKKDPHFRAVCETCSWEHENIRNAILDALNQFFVEKATWGLSMWERVLDLHPSPEDTYEQRRKKVLVKLQGTQTSTVSFLGKVVNVYGYGYIEEHNDKYYFNIYTTSTNTEDLKQMQNTIIYYKPAHLGLNVYLGFSWNGKIQFDGKYTYGSSTTKWEE